MQSFLKISFLCKLETYVIEDFIFMATQGRVAELERSLDSNPTLINQVSCPAATHYNPFPLAGQTALHWATTRGQIAVIELLLRRGALVNSVNEFNWTPLHWACFDKADEAAARVLIAAGADVNIKDRVSN